MFSLSEIIVLDGTAIAGRRAPLASTMISARLKCAGLFHAWIRVSLLCVEQGEQKATEYVAKLNAFAQVCAPPLVCPPARG